MNNDNVTANFELNQGGSISGYIRESGTNNPIDGGWVRIYDQSGSYLGADITDSQGNYSYSGLAPGNYFARTDNTGYFDELWNNIPCPQDNCTIASGSPITVNNDNVTANFELNQGGSISGYIRESGTNNPIDGGWVRIYDHSGSYLGADIADSQGYYSYSGLAPGNYFARTDNTGYFDELWNNIPCPDDNCTVTNGTTIPVNDNILLANFLLNLDDLIFSTGFE
ncbi:MAG: carboxypeptidase regulatory-like domain-containing protein [Marinicella sp.]